MFVRNTYTKQQENKKCHIYHCVKVPADVTIYGFSPDSRLQHRVSSLSLGFANQLVIKHENEKPQTQRTGLRFDIADCIGLFNRTLHVASSVLCVVVRLLPSICLYFVK